MGDLSQYTISGWLWLWTNPNAVTAPKGALQAADDIVIRRAGVIEPRPGFALLEASPTITGPINSLIWYDGYLFVHHNTTSISRWTGSTWSTYSGTFTPVDSTTRVKFFEAEQSLFALTSAGVYELDGYASTWRLTGAPQAIDGTATLNTTSGTSGFASANGQWAYRDVWAYKNAKGMTEYGAPSGRIIVANPAALTNVSGGSVRASNVVTVAQTAHGFAVGAVIDRSPSITNFAAAQFTVATVADADHFTYAEGSAGTPGNATSAADLVYQYAARNVTRTVLVPSQITAAALGGTGYFLQIYRSAKSASASDEPPDDALGLIYEKVPTNQEVATGTFAVSDITPDALRGALLYTSLAGVAAAKAQPPQCHEAATWRDCTWYCDTQQTHTTTLTLLGVGAPGGMQLGHLLIFGSVATPQVTNFSIAASAAEDAASGAFKIYTTGTASQNIANTARSIARVIAARSAITGMSATYLSGPDDAPGSIRITNVSSATAAFVIATSRGLTDPDPVAAYWSPALPEHLTTTDVTRLANVVTVTTSVTHGLTTGRQVQLGMISTASFASGLKTLTGAPSTTTFTYAETGANVTDAASNSVWTIPIALTASSNADTLNGVAFSVPHEPWAVPLINNRLVGGASKQVAAMTPLRDKLVLWTKQGTYQVTGNYPNFAVTELDLTANIIAPRSAAALNNRAMAFTNKGTVTAYDQVDMPAVSTRIEDKFLPLQAQIPSALAVQSFALPSETRKEYALYLPSATILTNTTAVNSYVWNHQTSTWVHHTVEATCGGLNPDTDVLYLGTRTGAVYVERKALTVADYQDPDGAGGTIGISTLIEPVLMDLDSPGAAKLALDGNLDFGPASPGDALGAANFTGGMTLKWETDLFQTLEATGTTYTPAFAPTLKATRLNFGVPLPYQRAASYRLQLTAQPLAGHFALSGLTINYRVTGTKTGR